MPSPKKPIDPTLPLVPWFWYPRTSPTVRGIIPHGRSQQDELIKAGKLARPIPAFPGSRETGWLGAQLIAIHEERLARAEAAAAAAAAETTKTPGTKATKARGKRVEEDANAGANV